MDVDAPTIQNVPLQPCTIPTICRMIVHSPVHYDNENE